MLYLQLLAERPASGSVEWVRNAATRGAAVAAGGMVYFLLVPAGHQVKHLHLGPS